MASHDTEEALEAFPSGLDDLIREPVREDLAWERGDVHAGRLVLEDIAEGLKVRIASAHERVAQLEGGDVRLKDRMWRREESLEGWMDIARIMGRTLHIIS